MRIWKVSLFLAAWQPLVLALSAAIGGFDRRGLGRKAATAAPTLRAADSHQLVTRSPRNLTAVLAALRDPESDDAKEHKAWQGPEGEEYDIREKRIERRCVGLQKCRNLCAWIKRSLLKKYGSAEEAYEAADRDGSNSVSNEEFMEQCVDAGVSDDAMSARGYIFIYIADINLDGNVSLKSYKRIFRIAEAADDRKVPAKLETDEQESIEESEGWKEVEMNEDFKASREKKGDTKTGKKEKKGEPIREEEQEVTRPSRAEKEEKDEDAPSHRSGAVARYAWSALAAPVLLSYLLLRL